MVGEETSSAVFQIVQIVPTVKADFPKMQEAKEGAEIILTAKVDGSPPPTAVWLLEGEEIQADGERVIITVEEDEDGGLGFTTTLRITKVHFFFKKIWNNQVLLWNCPSFEICTYGVAVS